MTTSKGKILSPTALERRLKKRRPRSLVFTNGCFDLLHPGHVGVLEKARAMGDVLVVAVNSDESVQKLKGPSRPINGLRERLRVIAALEAVSYVTWFSDETPRELILRLRPKVLVKGGDYQKEAVVGGAEVRSWGGRVRIVPTVPGQSTTGILIRSANPAG